MSHVGSFMPVEISYDITMRFHAIFLRHSGDSQLCRENPSSKVHVSIDGFIALSGNILPGKPRQLRTYIATGASNLL